MSFFNSVVSAVVGAVAAVANAVVSAVKSIVSAVSGKGSQDAGGMTALGAMATIADVFEDGEIDEDEEELLEEAFKLLVGAFIFPFDSGSSECNSAEEKSTIFDSVGAAVSKSWNSIKEIGHDFWSEADSRGQKAFNSGYDFANWLGCGVPDVVRETLKSNAERSEKAFDSAYDLSNWISSGSVDMVKETFNPKDPLSKEHWLNSFGTASAIFGIKETKGSVPKKSGVGVPEEFGGINKGVAKPTSIFEPGDTDFIGPLTKPDHHFIMGEGIGPKQRGVLGAHSEDFFNSTLESTGFSLNELKIGDPIPHPTIDGVYAQKYTIPSYNGRGELIGFKNIREPKTVFEPNKIPGNQMLKWGKEAMENGTINGRIIEGSVSNGLQFRGYIENGEVTNFFPVVPN
ncbi:MULTISPECIES: CdiA family toxin C-terminal domain-containing protein [unclassified Clostridium]|uniref:CdiA family toxin C-terminal domain-containing protein n=1 Tax=unclassified Clostridium TaxID=2614128 RepID=UPI00207A7135|nr:MULTISPECIES: CdiA family toxin C-terminal domain-containing protein [unclassified Clostridium]